MSLSFKSQPSAKHGDPQVTEDNQSEPPPPSVDKSSRIEPVDAPQVYHRDSVIHAVFEEQVRRFPSSIALSFRTESLTYEQLNRRANRLGHFLRKSGVGPGVSVSVCTERSLEMVVGLLGILKAGGVYVPLDPAYPKERLYYMLQDASDASAPVILTQRHLVPSLPRSQAKVVCLDDDWQSIALEPDDNLPHLVGPESLAYLMYTSGSTGNPKGVEVPHRGVVRLVRGAEYASFGSDRVFLLLASISFDASTFEIWGPLLNGGRCEICPDRLPSPTELGRILKDRGVTTLWLTSSLFNATIDNDPNVLSSLDELLIGGEALSVPHVRRALAALPHTRIINGYGPTESTTFACCYSIPPFLAEDLMSIPIGYPIASTQVYILNPSMQEVPRGEVGEIYIGGDGLARGYARRPDLTAEKFVSNPFGPPESRLYRSGDLGRLLPDDAIEFMGRVDLQVKIRGFRVEPGEIEMALARHPSVAQCVVVVREDVPGDKRLVAYIVVTPGSDGSTRSADEFRGFLQQKLPEYMVPSAFVLLDSLPLNTNGKIDRSALPAVERPESAGAYAPPLTQTEQKLAAIFSKLLNVDQVGIHDDFFNSGGHSLLALQLMARIEDAFKTSISLTTILESPSVGTLAAILDGKVFTSVTEPVIVLQPYGSRPPVFLVPGHGGHVIALRDLALQLGSDQPSYGLQPRGLFDQMTPDTSIPELGAYLVEGIKRACPEGPILIAGFSSGGIIAYEVAQQLRNAGRTVAMLGLLDTFAPGYPKRVPPVTRLVGHFQLMLRMSGGEASSYFIARLKDIVARLRAWHTPPPIQVTAASESLKPGIIAHAHALCVYTPLRYDGRIDLFRATERPYLPGSDFSDRTNGWSAFAAEIHTHEIPSSHMQIIDDGVVALADRLKQCLRVVEELHGFKA